MNQLPHAMNLQGVSLHGELAFALELAEQVAEYARVEYERFEPIPDAHSSISTHVDKEVQERILQAIRRKYPSDAFVAEENTPTARETPTSERRWVIDPIDGTKGFARKTGEFSIMIGLTIQNQVVLGVVAEPIPERTTYAVKGQGCFVKRGSQSAERCYTRTASDFSSSVLVQSRSRAHGPLKPVVELLKPHSIVEIYSAGVKLAIVARGEADYYVNDYAGFNDWDICAGDILVTEAGGVVSLFNGKPILYGAAKAEQQSSERRGMIACTQTLYPEVLSRLKPLLAMRS